LSESFGFGDERRDEVRLFLKQLLHFNALFFRALTIRKSGHLFFYVRWNYRGGTPAYFVDVAFEELQQDFEIIIHGKRVVKGKRG
jgi:hypothetical protein